MILVLIPIYLLVFGITLIVFNYRKSIFKNILENPKLKEEFFDSIKFLNNDIDTEIDPNKDYSPDFIFEIMNSKRSIPITIKKYLGN